MTNKQMQKMQNQMMTVTDCEVATSIRPSVI